MLEVACHACWAAGGSVNHAKLQAFKVRLRLGQLHLCTGTVHTVLGPQQYKRGELSLAGIPMLMGSHPTAAIAKTLAKLRLILFGVYRLRPSYCLALRIVLHYAISKMDFVHEAVPPTSSRLTPVQRSSDAVLTAALHIPRSTPRVLLHAPLRSGGFGAPHLVTRFQLRYIQGLFKALSSRNALVRHTSRMLLARPEHLAVNNDDFAQLRQLLRVHNLQISTTPHTTSTATADTHNFLREYSGAEVALISDGSSPQYALGWGALVADIDGVLATTCGGLQCHVSFSWAAEWLGKYTNQAYGWFQQAAGTSNNPVSIHACRRPMQWMGRPPAAGLPPCCCCNTAWSACCCSATPSQRLGPLLVYHQ